MHPFTRVERRPLTKEERALVEWLIANGNPDAQQYASQLSELRVVGRCTCGCPSLDLGMGDQEERTVGLSHVLADFDGVTVGGVQVGVILHAREGRISELEIYAVQDFEGSFDLPIIQSLKTC
jgi:hypothetical protein